jgi:hypothetical protein
VNKNTYQTPAAELGVDLEATQIFRVRISTAILIVALACFPYASLWVPPPHLFPQGSKAGETLSWFLYDFSGALFGVALLAALATSIVLAVKKSWRGIPQLIIEMLVCIVCVVSLPVY